MIRSALFTFAILTSGACNAAPHDRVYACDGLDAEVFYTLEQRARCVEVVAPNPGSALYRCAAPDGMPIYSGRVIPNANCSLIATLSTDEERRDSPPPPQEAPPAWETPRRTFGGYSCTQDCSGHEAGYAWAEDMGIEDASNCGGRSNSFIEGCHAYVEDNFPDSDEDGIPDEDEDDLCIDNGGC